MKTIIESSGNAKNTADSICCEENLRKLCKVFSAFLSTQKTLPEAIKECEISLTFALEEEIAEINNKYREINEPTDVLSFPMWENEEGYFTPPEDWESLSLGDIVICPSVVSKNAAENDKSASEETILVLCHGFLHLIGYDHAFEEERKVMWSTQDLLVQQFFDACSENEDELRCGITKKQANDLIASALEAREKAYAPYSKFKVGAAILFDNGETVSGCNVENASFGMSICAERNAMTSAVTLGLINPKAIAIVGSKHAPCPPCGACRQFLSEFNPQLAVILEDDENIVEMNLEDLLPYSFSLAREN